MYLVEEIKDGFIKDILSCIGYGAFALVFAIPLTVVGFALKNDEYSLLVVVIFVFVSAGVMYLLFIGMVISIIKSVVNMIKFLKEEKIEFYDADLMESKDKYVKFLLEQLKDKHIKLKNIVHLINQNQKFISSQQHST